MEDEEVRPAMYLRASSADRSHFLSPLERVIRSRAGYSREGLSRACIDPPSPPCTRRASSRPRRSSPPRSKPADRGTPVSPSVGPRGSGAPFAGSGAGGE